NNRCAVLAEDEARSYCCGCSLNVIYRILHKAEDVALTQSNGNLPTLFVSAAIVCQLCKYPIDRITEIIIKWSVNIHRHIVPYKQDHAIRWCSYTHGG